jgi:hypothetical protein
MDPFFHNIIPHLRHAESKSPAKLASMKVPHFSCSLVVKSVRTKASMQAPGIVDVKEGIACEFYDRFGADRFLTVTLKKLHDSTHDQTQVENLHRFCCDGIDLAGRHYAVVGGELMDKADKAKTEQSEESDTGSEDRGSVRVWFFAESDSDSYLPVLRVSYLLQWLGHFPVATLPSKINARIKLGFSKTVAFGQLLSNDQIIVQDDIKSETGNVMTDGCGFISNTLAQFIPYAVSNGLPRCERTEQMSLPSMVQIRLRCGHGLFKGCLTVVSDTSICPAGKIVLRVSMRKAGPSTAGTDELSTLRVNCTFEHPHCLDSAYSPSILLNRQLCMVLRALGVPYAVFHTLMNDELIELLDANLDQKKAYRLVQRYTRTSNSGRIDNESSPPDRDYDPKLGHKAWRFMAAGHGLDEPMLADHIKKIQLDGVKKLEMCRMRLAESEYLVGAPDPTGTLREGEVYVLLPKDSSRRRTVIAATATVVANNISTTTPATTPTTAPATTTNGPPATVYDAYSVTGKVAVTRTPMYMPGEIRMLQAVSSDILCALLADTSGGVILFSTQGKQTPAAYMSGGDFDGDKYYVIYNKQITEAITEADPFEQEGDLVPAAAAQQPQPGGGSEDLQYEIVSGLVKDACESIRGRYGSALKSWSDHCYGHPLDPSAGGGPGGAAETETETNIRQAKEQQHIKNMTECYRIFCVALDAPKTGLRPRLNPKLINVTKLHYMSDTGVFSDSVVGKLYDMVKAVSVKLSKRSNEVLVDPELTYRDRRSKQSLADAQKSFLTDVNNAQCPVTGKTFGLKWLDYYKNYKNEMFCKLKDRDQVEKNQRILALKMQYICMFDEDAISLFRMRYPNRELSSFEEGSDEELRFNGLKEKCRRQLATVVYLAVYSSASRDKGSYAPSVSFCWEVCGEELHTNKGENASRNINTNGNVNSASASMMETLISSEMKCFLS